MPSDLRAAEKPREFLFQLALVLLPLLCFWKLVTGGVIADDDSIELFVPCLEHFRRSLELGLIPLWNPYLMAGQSLAGFQNSPIYYPPNYLVYWLGPERYIVWSCILHISWGCLGHFRLARSWDLSPAAAFCVALFLGYTGFVYTSFERYPMVQILGWLPWFIWLLERNFSGQRRALALAGLVLGVQLLCAFPQVIQLQALVVGVLALFRWRAQVGWKRLLLDLALVSLPALLVASPYLLCLRDYMSSNVRNLADASYYQVYPVDIRELLYGMLVTIPRAYCVSPLITLLALGGAVKAGRVRWEYWCLVLLGLGLALANATRFEPLAALVPLYKSLRYRENYLYLSSLGLGWLAGFGVERWLNRTPPASRGRLGLGLALASVVAVLPGAATRNIVYDAKFVRVATAFKLLPQEDDFYRILVLPHLPSQYWNWGVFYNLSNISGYNGAADLAEQKLLHQAEYGVPMTQDSVRNTLARNMIRLKVDLDAPILRNLCVRYELSSPSARSQPRLRKCKYPTVAHAFLPARLHAAGEEQAIQAMSRADFDPQQDCYLNEIPDGVDVEGPMVEARVRQNNSDNLEVSLPAQARPRLLVLSEIYDPGWRAAGLKVVPVNLALRGVLVPAGVSRIDLVYLPRGILWGLPLAVLGLLSLAVLAGRR
ncbi:hypothetical protein JST97_01025 [bacterium]|nr:hypothetical protein [bacterium]